MNQLYKKLQCPIRPERDTVYKADAHRTGYFGLADIPDISGTL